MPALISCHTVIIRVFTNLTPFIPLSFKGEGEEIYREGFHPSLTYTPPSLAKGKGSGGWVAKQSLTMALIPKLVPLSGMKLNALEYKYVVCPEFQDTFAAKS